jgi:hypothetical protein
LRQVNDKPQCMQRLSGRFSFLCIGAFKSRD